MSEPKVSQLDRWLHAILRALGGRATAEQLGALFPRPGYLEKLREGIARGEVVEGPEGLAFAWGFKPARDLDASLELAMLYAVDLGAGEELLAVLRFVAGIGYGTRKPTARDCDATDSLLAGLVLRTVERRLAARAGAL